MDASVAICTYNRASYLGKTLQALVKQLPAANQHKVEVIVVDNNSTDQTRVVVEHIMEQSDASITYAHEPSQGLSYARNKAIEVCRSAIILFLDDDAIPGQNWVSEHLRVFETTNAACVGGRIELGWEAERPDWLGDPLLVHLGNLDYADKVVQFSGKQLPFGGNISFRREWLQRVGGFDGTLGRRGKLLLDAEEIAVCQRIRQLGGEIWYTPKAGVVHMVAPDRLRKNYFLRSAYWKGRSAARLGIVTGARMPTFLRAVKRGLVRLPVDALSFALFSFFGRSARAMYHRCELQTDVGYVREYVRYLLNADTSIG